MLYQVLCHRRQEAVLANNPQPKFILGLAVMKRLIALINEANEKIASISADQKERMSNLLAAFRAQQQLLLKQHTAMATAIQPPQPIPQPTTENTSENTLWMIDFNLDGDPGSSLPPPHPLTSFPRSMGWTLIETWALAVANSGVPYLDISSRRFLVAMYILLEYNACTVRFICISLYSIIAINTIFSNFPVIALEWIRRQTGRHIRRECFSATCPAWEQGRSRIHLYSKE